MPRKPDPGSARAAIDTLLQQSQEPLTKVQIVAMLVEQDHSEAAIGTALKDGVNAGRYQRLGTGKPYTYRVAAEPPQAGAYSGPAFDRGPIGPQLGVVCHPAAIALRPVPPTEVAAAIDAALDDDLSYTLDEIGAALHWQYTRDQLREGLAELVHLGRAMGVAGGRTEARYVLTGPPEEPLNPWSPHAKARVERAVQQAARTQERQRSVPSWMGDRLDAIATDLVDASGDACDAQLPHAVIKALVTASDAVRHARRQLE